MEKKLTKEQLDVLRKGATEKPFSGKLLHNKERGTYKCAYCGAELFKSDKKFDSGTGWPSFSDAIKENVELKEDNSFGMKRTEIICKKCKSHLGHVFDDGPKPSCKRYCINSLALDFNKENKNGNKTEKAVFGAGCFWHVEEEFSKLNGVIETSVGFMGGDEEKYPDPSYEQVSSDKTNYAEVIYIEYNPEIISYKDLLEVFWKIHNPTTKNRQGPDFGTQYRSVIFYYGKGQKTAAEKAKEKIQKNFEENIVTEIVPAKQFFKAEEYHQRYFEKNKGVCGI